MLRLTALGDTATQDNNTQLLSHLAIHHSELPTLHVSMIDTPTIYHLTVPYTGHDGWEFSELVVSWVKGGRSNNTPAAAGAV